MSEQLKNISAEFSWVDRVHTRFKETGDVMPTRQRKLYEAIKNEFASGMTILDMGCSLGIGSNILSHEARFVWGVDINSEAINFAKKAFKRPNLDFEVIDIENPPTRELAEFEVITMIECLEHLERPEVGLNNLKRFFGTNAIGLITIPNYANEEVRANEAKHGLHLNHWTAGDFYALMTTHFNSVVMYSVDKLDGWKSEALVDGNSTDYLIVGKVEQPK